MWAGRLLAEGGAPKAEPETQEAPAAPQLLPDQMATVLQQLDAVRPWLKPSGRQSPACLHRSTAPRPSVQRAAHSPQSRDNQYNAISTLQLSASSRIHEHVTQALQ